MAHLAEQINALRPESRFLIQCARVSSDPGNEATIREIVAEGVDWDYVLRMANFPHGMLPLIHNCLLNIADGVIPQTRREQFQECYRKIAVKNLYITKELLRIVTLLNSKGIEVVPFKGPILAISAYGNLALRQFCDLDIFIREGDVRNAIAILVSQGYRLNRFTEEQVPSLIRSKKDFQLVSDNEEVVLEIHWRLIGKRFPFSLELSKLWDQLEIANVSGIPVASFPSEETLLYLCLHGSKHLWERLIWVADVARLIHTKPNLNWERLEQLADSHGCHRVINLGLLLAHELLGARVPTRVLFVAQADKRALLLARQAIDKLFNNDTRVNRPTELHSYHINMRERLRDKAVLGYHYSRDYCKALTTPNRDDKSAIALPDGFDFLYYVLRPIRLFHTALKRQ